MTSAALSGSRWAAMHPGEVWSPCTDWLTSRYRKDSFFFPRSDNDLPSFATLHLTSKLEQFKAGSDVCAVYDPTALAWHRVESCVRHASQARRQGFCRITITKHRQMFESPGFKWNSASLVCGGVSSALLSSRAYLHEGYV